jgi:outer membrane protein, heavy metal efflux system
LWGNPSDVGNRTDFSLIQSFDFPTAYRYKNQISGLKTEQSEILYQKQLKAILTEARLICVDLVYYNALISELRKRLEHAQSIASSYKSKLDAGEANILEYNKSRLNLLTAQKKYESNEIERNALMAQLTRLNGGVKLDFLDKEYQAIMIPDDFDQWYFETEQNNPMLAWLKYEIEIGKKQVGLTKAKSLPEFQAGYMSETVLNQQFKGISFGINIPLWEDKNKVKYEKAKTEALEHFSTDQKLQFYNQLKTLHTKVIEMQKSVSEYRTELRILDNSDLLLITLESGEISLINYIFELSVYYENVNQLLDYERELNRAFAELQQFM